nr:MAG TPA: hypothetical protein [Caudoviricetes sp.]
MLCCFHLLILPIFHILYLATNYKYTFTLLLHVPKVNNVYQKLPPDFAAKYVDAILPVCYTNYSKTSIVSWQDTVTLRTTQEKGMVFFCLQIS